MGVGMPLFLRLYLGTGMGFNLGIGPGIGLGKIGIRFGIGKVLGKIDLEFGWWTLGIVLVMGFANISKSLYLEQESSQWWVGKPLWTDTLCEM